MPAPGRLGLGSGIGLAVANMVGAGCFLSFGFMAQDLGPGAILLAWVAGAVLALCGAAAYATVARWVPRSGGEYRYLSELMHPAAGVAAGWASVLVGFAGPIAIDALGAGAFANAVFPGIDPRSFAASMLAALVAMHLIDLRASTTGQNVLVAVKICLVVGFALVGLGLGARAWPQWAPPHASTDLPIAPFMQSLFFVAFAFSGWNAAAYAAEEFRNPTRDVPRSMLLGCLGVGTFYLAINWVFVANLTPARAEVVFDYEQSHITLAHVVATDLLGAGVARWVSMMIVVAFVSAASAMIFVGPRVVASMAQDGVLPRVFVARPGRPPVAALVLQGTIAMVIVFAEPVRDAILDVSGILVLFSALTVATLFVAPMRRANLPAPSPLRRVAAAVYVASSGWMLYFGFRAKTHLLHWIVVVFAVAAVAFWWRHRRDPRRT